MSHKCLCCGSQITDPDDEELVPGMSSPVRYKHKDYTGCQEALAHPSVQPPARATRRPRRTLDAIEAIPDHGHWNKS